MIKENQRFGLYTSMVISKFLKRKTASSYDSVSSKSTEKISWDKDEENINVITNCNNKGIEEDFLTC